ncbi:MAG: response regulator transcription factor [Rhodothermales bacterium]|nr:response regulator transcription factor [Rhodothermales bacterium]
MADDRPTSGTVLLVDDEEDLLDLLSYTLEREGYTVVTAQDGAEGFKLAQEARPDLVVLDIMMPKMDGIELCQRLREDARLRLTPILMLTAKSEEGDEIVGLEAGADDYLPKPVSPRLLVSHVRALLRRSERTEAATTNQLRVHDLVVDRDRYVVTRAGAADEPIRLPRKEFELLYFLASHPGKVFTREDLLNQVWGPDVYVVDRTVDVHVRKIREKIGSDYIETVKGVGYKLNEAL